VPADLVETLDEESLPKGWNAADVPEAARGVGDRWLASGRSVALRVPSAVIPLEPNLVVDPLHADFGRLTIHPAERAELDPRLVRLRPLAAPTPFRPRRPRGG